jgi:LPS-assembly lipoprotein
MRANRTPLRLARPILGLAFVLTLGACGFHLRGQSTLPFDTINLAAPEGLQVGEDLRRSIASGSRTRLVDRAADAQVVLQVVGEQRERVILSLTGAGRVSEFQLRYRFVYRLHDGKGHDIIPQNEIVLTREMSYSDQLVLAKEAEEQLLYRDMQRDMVRQVMRRLAAAKLQDPS